MWMQNYLRNMTQSVALAYSEEIGRHVLVFVEQASARPPKTTPKKSDQREIPMLQRLANMRSLSDLAEVAMYYGSLFDGTQTCTPRYTTTLHGDSEDFAFAGRFENFRAPSQTTLAQEFYRVEKPTRTQLRHACYAIKTCPFDGTLPDTSDLTGRDMLTVRAEPLSDWVAFASMLERCIQAKVACRNNENRKAIQTPDTVGTTWIPIIAEAPLPSLYGHLLESYATEDDCSELSVNGLATCDRELCKYVIGRAWMPGEFFSSDENGAYPVDKIINLHARGTHIELHGSKVNRVSSSKAPLLFAEVMDEIAKSHVGICAREGCGRVFFAKRSDTRFCSNACKTQASKKGRESND